MTDTTILLCTLNAKYIHASLGLRCLLANMGDLRAQTALREFTIARQAQDVVDELLRMNPAIIGLGVYIWNATQSCEVVRLIRQQRPAVKIVLGGPEVSHETDSQEIVRLADHVITGWGDLSFAKLCRALLLGPQPLMKIMAGEQPPLDQIALPYAEYSDADLAHRLLYVEASRGCPFKCEFCLSSLDKTAWAFDLDLFLAGLGTLYQRGARNFKFVDRTFNLKIDASLRILQFFLDKLEEVASVGASGRSAGPPQARPAPSGLSAAAPISPARDGTARRAVASGIGLSSAAHAVASVGASLFLHFEVIPDHLPDRLKQMIARFPPGVLQFEVGIQTFNVEVQQRISRRQDNDRTEANLRWLADASNAHLHTDLIFGLPGESLASFAAGFDRLHALRPHEIQLGILKRLRGTPIARHTAEYAMVYDDAPPYTVRQTGAVSAGDMQRFTRMARYWDLLANSGRFSRSLGWLMAPGEPVGAPSPFQAFMDLSDWLWRATQKTSGLTPEALVDALFDYLTVELGRDPAASRETLRADYLASGARASPRALQGLLPRHAKPQGVPLRPLAARQSRHGPALAEQAL